MKFTAIIVDDEFKARDVFTNLLKKYCPEIGILAEADNIEDAYKLIIEKKPDVVFLDIEMPGGSGFDLLSKFTDIVFEIIFITSYSTFAIQAIKFSALDYLLKPILVDDLKQMVVRLENKMESNFKAQQYVLLKENLLNSSEDQKLVINTKTKLEYVAISDIIYFKADGNYTTIFLTNDVKFYVAKTLKEYEGILCQHTNDLFVRIHKGYIVNIFYIKHIEKGEKYSIILKDGTCLDVSKRKKQALMDKLNFGKVPLNN